MKIGRATLRLVTKERAGVSRLHPRFLIVNPRIRCIHPIQNTRNQQPTAEAQTHVASRLDQTSLELAALSARSASQSLSICRVQPRVAEFRRRVAVRSMLWRSCSMIPGPKTATRPEIVVLMSPMRFEILSFSVRRECNSRSIKSMMRSTSSLMMPEACLSFSVIGAEEFRSVEPIASGVSEKQCYHELAPTSFTWGRVRRLWRQIPFLWYVG